jgi:hypothetical protein
MITRQSLYRKLEVGANVAIIVVAVLLAFVLVRNFILSGQRPQPSAAAITAGQKVTLPEVDWARNQHTLLLVLATNCHFCSESAPFYQRLVQAVGGRGDLHLIAVLPQGVAEGQQYLSRMGVPISDVRQAEPSTFGVRGTPTLLLVDGAGTVTQVWVGKLRPEQEAEVLQRLQTANAQAVRHDGARAGATPRGVWRRVPAGSI